VGMIVVDEIVVVRYVVMGVCYTTDETWYHGRILLGLLTTTRSATPTGSRMGHTDG